MTEAEFLALVHRLSVKSANVRITPHAKEKMSERFISTRQVFEVLRKGRMALTEPVHREIRGDWKGNLSRLVAGENVEVTVALAGPDATKLWVVTVFFRRGY